MPCLQFRFLNSSFDLSTWPRLEGIKADLAGVLFGRPPSTAAPEPHSKQLGSQYSENVQVRQ